MNLRFSADNRSSFIKELSSGSFDIVVIGGGITGAGIALDAQTRGLRCALLEMQDFAGGTSSRSTKLIHGGLRYLKQRDFGLVAATGRERVILKTIAPHLVEPIKVIIPVVEKGSYNKFSLKVAMWMYERLSKIKRISRHKMHNKASFLKEVEGFEARGLKGGVEYTEYLTNDSRLTLEIVKKAYDQGAVCLNYSKVTGFLYDNEEKVKGVTVEDQYTGEKYEVRSTQVINASGPWTDLVCSTDKSDHTKKLVLSKGIHLVTDRSRFPLEKAVYFDTPDRRMIFAIPRGKKTYFGTTDTIYNGNIRHPRLTQGDMNYLLDAVNAGFPSLGLTLADIESGWAGVRPLIKSTNANNPSEISRKDEIFLSPTNLISIAGGKLTGYRKMAEKAVNVALSFMSKDDPRESITDHVKLSGGDFENEADKARFEQRYLNQADEYDITKDEMLEILQRYGSNSIRVLGVLQDQVPYAENFGLSKVELAMLIYSIEHEMVTRPSDFLTRRTGYTYFNQKRAKSMSSMILAYMNDRFGWSEEELKRQQGFTDALFKLQESVPN